MPAQRSIASRRLWQIGVSLALLGTAAAVLYPLRVGGAEPASAAAAPPAAAVSVASVVQRDITNWSEFSGRLEAVERVDVRARVGGVVQSLLFREGALVQQGDLLATIDPAPYAADVDRAQAQVAAAEARALFSATEFERARQLLAEDAIARREFDEKAHAQREAEANLRAALATLQSARLALGYTQVRAPISGRVGRREVTVGNLIAAGPEAPVLTTLVSVHPIYASFDADEQVVAQALRELPAAARARAQLERVPVQMGTSATADLPFTGRLQLIDNQVDAKSGTLRARAVFDNADGRLIPGQFVKLRMGQAATSPALLINERAVSTDQSRKFVIVVGADNRAAYREVSLGAHSGDLVVVTSGLKPDERIVVDGLQRVRPGALVAPALVPMLAKSDASQANR
jgi:multidrug efflux system membrane fusion protein